VTEEAGYECPECGTTFPEGVSNCPGCGIEFNWDEDPQESVEEAIDRLVSETEKPPAEAPVEEEAPVEADEGVPEEPPELSEEAIPEETEEVPGGVPEAIEEAEEGVPWEPPEAVPEAIPEGGVEVPPGPRLYGGVLSWYGLAFAVLAFVALLATVIAIRWDTWIGGGAEESIGDRQVMFIYLGAAATIVCALITVVDTLRSGRARRG
jgi:predicted  nucleic acid-binding Zn-ribbon protein